MCKSNNCYKTSINEAFLLDEKLLKYAEQIVIDLKIKSSIGRPQIEFVRALNGIYLFALKIILPDIGL
jgi:hypothetical protein